MFEFELKFFEFFHINCSLILLSTMNASDRAIRDTLALYGLNKEAAGVGGVFQNIIGKARQMAPALQRAEQSAVSGVRRMPTAPLGATNPVGRGLHTPTPGPTPSIPPSIPPTNHGTAPAIAPYTNPPALGGSNPDFRSTYMDHGGAVLPPALKPRVPDTVSMQGGRAHLQKTVQELRTRMLAPPTLQAGARAVKDPALEAQQLGGYLQHLNSTQGYLRGVPQSVAPKMAAWIEALCSVYGVKTAMLFSYEPKI